MKETLEAADYRVTLAADGLEAIAVAEKAQPKIALIDIMMPRSGGRETMQELRKRFPDLRMIAISGLSDVETRAAAPEADAILQKPFTVQQLLAALQS